MSYIFGVKICEECLLADHYTSAVPIVQTFGQGLRVKTSPGRQKCMSFDEFWR